jgi:hypothetical protein
MNTPPRKESESGMYAPVWRKINQLIDYVRETSVVNGRDVRITRTMNGTLIKGEAAGKEAPAQDATLQEVTVTSVSWDHYVCWNGSEQVLVAKPYKLRRSPFNGTVNYVDEVGRAYAVTYNYTHPSRRSASMNGTLVEYQVVIPRYVTPTDKIYIIGGSITVDIDGVQRTLDFLDINADGRAWARER